MSLFCSKLANHHSRCATLHRLFVNGALVIVEDIDRGLADKRRATMPSGKVLLSRNSIFVRVQNPGSRVIVRKRKHPPCITARFNSVLCSNHNHHLKKGRASSLGVRACVWHHRRKQYATSVDKQYRACKSSTADTVASTLIRLAPKKENTVRLASLHWLTLSSRVRLYRKRRTLVL